VDARRSSKSGSQAGVCLYDFHFRVRAANVHHGQKIGWATKLPEYKVTAGQVHARDPAIVVDKNRFRVHDTQLDLLPKREGNHHGLEWPAVAEPLLPGRRASRGAGGAVGRGRGHFRCGRGRGTKKPLGAVYKRRPHVVVMATTANSKIWQSVFLKRSHESAVETGRPRVPSRRRLSLI